MSEQTPPPERWQNLRTMWTFIRPHRLRLFLGFLLGLGTTLTSLATPLVTKSVLDGFGVNASIDGPVITLVTLLIAGAFFALGEWVLLGRLAEQIVLDARSSMVRRLFRVRVGELTSRSSGELVTRVTSDTVLLRQAAASSVVELFNGSIALLGSLVAMGLLDWVLLACTFAALGGVGIAVAILMPKMAAAQERAQAAVGRLGGALEGALRAIRTVKASRAESRESDRILAEAKESKRQAVRAVGIEAIAFTTAGMGMRLAILVILAIGAWRVGAGALAVSSLVAFLLYAFQVAEPVSTLTTTIGQLQSGVAAAARIREVDAMQIEPADAVTGKPEGGDPSGTVLSFRDVTARYAPGGDPTVSGINIEIPRTGHVAIVGPSGAGKTTMFSLMLRFLQPEHGELTLDGIPFDQWSLEDVRKRIVYVEQDAPLLPGTLRENLLYTHADADEEALWTALRTVRLEERVRQLEQGLDTPMFGAAISGGERQRIALARALVSEPEILLLDEATAQLDGLTESAIQEAITRISSNGAVVTIAHRLSTVIDADQIFLLEKGRVRARGTHNELFEADELYRELVLALRIAGVTPAAAEDEVEAPVGI